MSDKVFIKGCHAVAESAIRAGCNGFFGYPITPQNEIGEYMSEHIAEHGGVFLQAESELTASAMVYGAVATGKRAMTSSSGPGIALMQETFSGMVASQVPCVIVNMCRGGPGGGVIQPGQCDYTQMVKGGGNGDYNIIVYTPNSVQELVDFTYLAFDTADKYRSPVFILGDAVLAQMMEKASFPDFKTDFPEKMWAANGRRADGVQRKKNYVVNVHVQVELCEAHNDMLQAKFNKMKEEEPMWVETETEGADLILVSYGISSRICETVVKMAKKEGLKIGLFRPQTVWPFPEKRLNELAVNTKKFLCVELSCGQMIEDVERILKCDAEAFHYGRKGGVIHTTTEILKKAKEIMGRGN